VPHDGAGSPETIAEREPAADGTIVYDRNVRRLLAWIAGLVSIAALARLLRRRRRPAPTQPEVTPTEGGEDPAEELRERLAAARADDAPPDDESVDAPSSLEERRARVHERAQDAIDAMRDPPESA
jgi:hypothetical protein